MKLDKIVLTLQVLYYQIRLQQFQKDIENKLYEYRIKAQGIRQTSSLSNAQYQILPHILPKTKGNVGSLKF